MAGILTKDMALAYGTGEDKKVLTNLMEIPEIGNNAPEKIDVTVLTDDVKRSISGLGDSAQDLAFKFLYEEKQFEDLAALTTTQSWEVRLPKNAENKARVATFTGTPSVKLGAAAPNGALTYTLNISVESKIDFPKEPITIE
jgi:hypothetical protein